MAKEKVKTQTAIDFEESLEHTKGIFHYKDNEYIVDSLTEMKTPSGDWVEAVYYYPTAMSDHSTYVRELNDFIAKFKRGHIPCTTNTPVLQNA